MMRSLFSVLMILVLSGGSASADNLPLYAFQNGVRLPTDEKRADLLAALGYDGIGSARLPEPEQFDELFEIYRSRGLKVFSFYVGVTMTEDGINVPPSLLSAIPLMKGHDITLELFVKGDKGLDRDGEAVAVIRQLAGVAQPAGVSIVLYPHTGMYVETIGDATRIAKKVDRPQVGVMFNLCHFLRVEPEKELRSVLQEASPFLRQVSVSGADVGGSDWNSLIQPLGRGTYEVADLLTILRDLEFAGPVGLQCYNIEGRSDDFLAESMAAWRSMNIAK